MIPKDVLWYIILKYLKSVYDMDGFAYSSLSCNEEHRNVEKTGIYLSGDLYLLRQVSKDFKNCIDKYVKYKYSYNQKRYVLDIYYF